MNNKKLRIAAIAGDGIGLEVLPEGVRVVQAAAARHGLELEFEYFEWASCDYYLKHGKMMPDDWFEQLKGFDSIFFGAVGWPEKVPDHISLWGSLLKFRREFDQYANIRPVRLFPGVPCPLANREPGDIDFVVVGKTPKVNTRRWAGSCSKTPKTNSCCRNRCSPVAVSTAFSSSPSRWPANASAST